MSFTPSSWGGSGTRSPQFDCLLLATAWQLGQYACHIRYGPGRRRTWRPAMGAHPRRLTPRWSRGRRRRALDEAWNFGVGTVRCELQDIVGGWMRGVQIKLWDPLRTRAIPERFSVFTTRRYTNSRLPLPFKSVVRNGVWRPVAPRSRMAK